MKLLLTFLSLILLTSCLDGEMQNNPYINPHLQTMCVDTATSFSGCCSESLGPQYCQNHKYTFLEDGRLLCADRTISNHCRL